ncbi:MAG: hypothetical protein LBM63_05650 [Rikenellaceae bacterium]|jgi:hypothetical protein|nr:hypothetical protein [Rikenellaceae bacterium]
MAAWLVILLFSVGAVVVFVVGMSLTLLIKGHHIDSEIATNKNMRARGITCAVQDARASSGGSSDLSGGSSCDPSCGSSHNCSTCAEQTKD